MEAENTTVQANPNLGELRPNGDTTQEVVAEQPQTPEVELPNATETLVPTPTVEEKTVENSTGAIAEEAVQS
jgi:hypothetical protein